MSTIQKGTVSVGVTPTAEILPDSLVIDMRDEVSMADADESQFTTFTMKSASGEASREKINWREKDYFPRLAVAVTYTNVAVTISVSAGHGDRIRKGDVLRNMVTGEAIWVQSVAADVLTVVRAIGAVTPGVAGTTGDMFLIASNASPQGADFPDTAVLKATLQSNYTQIFRHGYTFSRTAKAVNYYGRGEPDQESTLKLVEHKRAIEYSGFWGARDSKPDPTPAPGGSGEQIGFAGGLVEFIASNKFDCTSGGLTVDFFDSAMRQGLQKSSRNVAAYVSPVAAQVLSKLNRGGQGTAWQPNPQGRVGLKVDAFLSGVYGYEIPIVVKKDWNDFLTANKQYGGWIFVVDHDRVMYRTLTGGSTKLLTNRQSPGGDRVSEEWLTECTWEIRNEASHSRILGVVPPP